MIIYIHFLLSILLENFANICTKIAESQNKSYTYSTTVNDKITLFQYTIDNMHAMYKYSTQNYSIIQRDYPYWLTARMYCFTTYKQIKCSQIDELLINLYPNEFALKIDT